MPSQEITTCPQWPHHLFRIDHMQVFPSPPTVKANLLFARPASSFPPFSHKVARAETTEDSLPAGEGEAAGPGAHEKAGCGGRCTCKGHGDNGETTADVTALGERGLSGIDGGRGPKSEARCGHGARKASLPGACG
jgi:hypothetical protein